MYLRTSVQGEHHKEAPQSTWTRRDCNHVVMQPQIHDVAWKVWRQLAYPLAKINAAKCSRAHINIHAWNCSDCPLDCEILFNAAVAAKFVERAGDGQETVYQLVAVPVSLKNAAKRMEFMPERRNNTSLHTCRGKMFWVGCRCSGNLLTAGGSATKQGGGGLCTCIIVHNFA